MVPEWVSLTYYVKHSRLSHEVNRRNGTLCHVCRPPLAHGRQLALSGSDVDGQLAWGRQGEEMGFLASEPACSRGHHSAPEGGRNNSNTPIRKGAAPVYCFATVLAYCSVL